MFQNHVLSNATAFRCQHYLQKNKMGKNIGNPISRARNANIYGKKNIPPSVNVSTYAGNNTYIFYVIFLKIS